jgi:hypothetical protein
VFRELPPSVVALEDIAFSGNGGGGWWFRVVKSWGIWKGFIWELLLRFRLMDKRRTRLNKWAPTDLNHNIKNREGAIVRFVLGSSS